MRLKFATLAALAVLCAAPAVAQDRVSAGHNTGFTANSLAVTCMDPTTGALNSCAAASVGHAATFSFNRTADTNAYTANDVVGAATGSTAAIDLSALCPTAGGEILITSSRLQIALSSVPSGMTSFNMALYNVTPPSAYGDNAAWDEASGDRASYLGSVGLGSPVDIGSTLEVSTDGINRQITCPATGKLYGYLITNGGYTPASGTTYAGQLHATGL